MNSSIKARYTELISMVQLYLLQEYRLTERIYDCSEAFTFFRKQAQGAAAPSKTNAHHPKREPTNVSKVSKQPIQSAVAPVPPSPLLAASPPLLIQKKEAPVAVPPKIVDNPKTEKPQSVGQDGFAIGVLPPVKPIEVEDLRKIILEKMPHMQLLDSIPEEKRLVEAVIISAEKEPLHLDFLHKVSSAIETLGVHCKVCSMDDGEAPNLDLSALKLLIASPTCLESMLLLKGYVDTKRPYLVLEPIEHYMRDATLKRILWQSIKAALCT